MMANFGGGFPEMSFVPDSVAVRARTIIQGPEILPVTQLRSAITWKSCSCCFQRAPRQARQCEADDWLRPFW